MINVENEKKARNHAKGKRETPSRCIILHLTSSFVCSLSPLFVQPKQAKAANQPSFWFPLFFCVCLPALAVQLPAFQKGGVKKKGFFDLVFIAYHDSSADHPARYERHIALSRIIQEGKIHFFKKGLRLARSPTGMIVKRRRWLNYFEISFLARNTPI